MRVASVLFVLLALNVLVSNAVSWTTGVPVRVTFLTIGAVSLFGVLAAFLWRSRRWAAIVGLVAAVADLLIVFSATLFIWLYKRPPLDTPQGILGFASSAVIPIALDAFIIALLAFALLSNQRLEQP